MWKNVHTGNPQVLGAIVQNLIIHATWRLEFVHACAVAIFYNLLVTIKNADVLICEVGDDSKVA